MEDTTVKIHPLQHTSHRQVSISDHIIGAVKTAETPILAGTTELDSAPNIYPSIALTTRSSNCFASVKTRRLIKIVFTTTVSPPAAKIMSMITN